MILMVLDFNDLPEVPGLRDLSRPQQTFPEYSTHLTLGIIPNIAKPGSFDSAIEDVTGVIHTANPFQIFGVEDNERDLLKLGHLIFCRVILTSPFVAMADESNETGLGHMYSEKDWNLDTYEDAAASSAFAGTAYSTAKALVERAAWDFVRDKNTGFDISTIMPPTIYGPNIKATADLQKLNTSSADIYRLISPKSKSSDSVSGIMFWSFVDVRDVAEAHLRAYEVPEAGDGDVPRNVYTVDVGKSERVLALSIGR
ncbi:hypothetical protein BJX70DRAFT_390297 [Aspergillus crustosus]